MNKLELIKNWEELNASIKLTKYPSPIENKEYLSKKLFIKRDDLLDLGCSKQRSIPFLMYNYLEKGNEKFTISSSGNAALVAAYVALQESRIKNLKVFLPSNVSDFKIKKFIDCLELNTNVNDFRSGYIISNVEFILSQKAKQEAFALQKEGYINLRGSTEDLGIEGFKTIGYELAVQNKEIDAVFIPASSGSTAIGIYHGLKESGLHPQIHIVQTTRVYTLLKKINEKNIIEEPDHPSEAIVDIIGHRRKEIEEIMTISGGKGWVINKSEVMEAKEELKKLYNIEISYDGTLSFAAYKKALEENTFKNPVIMITG